MTIKLDIDCHPGKSIDEVWKIVRNSVLDTLLDAKKIKFNDYIEAFNSVGSMVIKQDKSISKFGTEAYYDHNQKSYVFAFFPPDDSKDEDKDKPYDNFDVDVIGKNLTFLFTSHCTKILENLRSLDADPKGFLEIYLAKYHQFIKSVTLIDNIFKRFNDNAKTMRYHQISDTIDHNEIDLPSVDVNEVFRVAYKTWNRTIFSQFSDLLQNIMIEFINNDAYTPGSENSEGEHTKCLDLCKHFDNILIYVKSTKEQCDSFVNCFKNNLGRRNSINDLAEFIYLFHADMKFIKMLKNAKLEVFLTFILPMFADFYTYQEEKEKLMLEYARKLIDEKKYEHLQDNIFCYFEGSNIELYSDRVYLRKRNEELRILLMSEEEKKEEKIEENMIEFKPIIEPGQLSLKFKILRKLIDSSNEILRNFIKNTSPNSEAFNFLLVSELASRLQFGKETDKYFFYGDSEMVKTMRIRSMKLILKENNLDIFDGKMVKDEILNDCIKHIHKLISSTLNSTSQEKIELIEKIKNFIDHFRWKETIEGEGRHYARQYDDEALPKEFAAGYLEGFFKRLFTIDDFDEEFEYQLIERVESLKKQENFVNCIKSSCQARRDAKENFKKFSKDVETDLNANLLIQSHGLVFERLNSKQIPINHSIFEKIKENYKKENENRLLNFVDSNKSMKIAFQNSKNETVRICVSFVEYKILQQFDECDCVKDKLIMKNLNEFNKEVLKKSIAHLLSQNILIQDKENQFLKLNVDM